MKVKNTVSSTGVKRKIRSMKDLRVSLKLLISHGVIVVLSLCTIIACIYGIVSMKTQMKGLYDGPTTSLDYMGNIQYAAPDMQRVILWNILLGETGNVVEISTLEQTLAEDRAMMDEALQIMSDSLISEEAKAYRAEIDQNLNDAAIYRTEIVSQIKAGDYDGALETYYSYREYVNAIRATANEMNSVIRGVGENYITEAETLGNILIAVAVVLTVLATTVAIIMMRVISKMIATPVQQITTAATMMRQGDLSGAKLVTYEADDELGELAEAMRGTLVTLDGYIVEISGSLETMSRGDLTEKADEITDFLGQFAAIKKSLVLILNNFNSTMSDIQHAASQVNTGSTQISDGAQQLAQGATEQASSVQELSATINDITSQVNNTAKNATSAMEEMDSTGRRVEECNEQMQQMTTAMEEIADKSNEISKIIKTIEDIAFQTNILALNAAVEAARAGAAGKGFAVVADEVRNLAAKSAAASKDTADLIGGTVNAVNQGNKVVRETAETLGYVVEGTKTVTKLVSDITSDAQREATALNQVTEGIDQISRVVQTNSATAEQSAAAGGELSTQAERLNDLIARFELGTGYTSMDHDRHGDTHSYESASYAGASSFSKY